MRELVLISRPEKRENVDDDWSISKPLRSSFCGKTFLCLQSLGYVLLMSESRLKEGRAVFIRDPCPQSV